MLFDGKEPHAVMLQFITPDGRATMPRLVESSYAHHRSILIRLYSRYGDVLHSAFGQVGTFLVIMWPDEATRWTADNLDQGSPQWWRPA